MLYYVAKSQCQTCIIIIWFQLFEQPIIIAHIVTCITKHGTLNTTALAGWHALVENILKWASHCVTSLLIDASITISFSNNHLSNTLV